MRNLLPRVEAVQTTIGTDPVFEAPAFLRAMEPETEIALVASETTGVVGGEEPAQQFAVGSVIWLGHGTDIALPIEAGNSTVSRETVVGLRGGNDYCDSDCRLGIELSMGTMILKQASSRCDSMTVDRSVTKRHIEDVP